MHQAVVSFGAVTLQDIPTIGANHVKGTVLCVSTSTYNP